MTLSVTEARKTVFAHAKPMAREKVHLDAGALGRVLALPLNAPQPSPRWDVSAMDGFAVRSCDFPAAYEGGLGIQGAALAGSAPLKLSKPASVRIMTGAVIPLGADAVVPKEWIREAAGRIYVAPGADVAKGDHIRVAGEELKQGVRVAEAGTVLSSRWIGFLNGLGLAEALVIRKPRVALLVTGTELKAAPARLKPGQIHDSNLPMLQAALAEQGIQGKAKRLRDEPRMIKQALQAALASSDLLLLSGGVSVGDADHSKGALQAAGVETLFWGVAQKPGKPLYFGRRGSCLVFGLPGNPAAAWVCFHEYVRPALRAMQGLEPSRREQAQSTGGVPPRDRHKTLFLKARQRGSQVELLSGQQSHMLRSLAEANALAVLEPGGRGNKLELHPL